MANIEKFNQLSGYAFENGIRVHMDSIRAYKDNSFATAYHLALLASEEIGKAMMLEEYYWQYHANGWSEEDPWTNKFLVSIFSAHKAKQGWFGRRADDFFSSHPRLMMEGAGEDAKQNSTYVGLTKKGKKVDLNGKMIIPRLYAQPGKAKKQITLNNDFLSVYTSGFLRGINSTDSYYIAENLDKDYLDLYLKEWVFMGRQATKILKNHEKYPFVENPLEDWE